MTWVIIPGRDRQNCKESNDIWGVEDTALAIVIYREDSKLIKWIYPDIGDHKTISFPDKKTWELVIVNRFQEEDLSGLLSDIHMLNIFAHFGSNLAEYNEDPQKIINEKWTGLAGTLQLTGAEGWDKWEVLPYSLGGGMPWWGNHLKGISTTIKESADNGIINHGILDSLEKAWNDAYDHFFKRAPNENLAKILFPVYVAASILRQKINSGNNNEHLQSFNAVHREVSTQIGSRKEWGDWNNLVMRFRCLSNLSKESESSALEHFCREYESLAKAVTGSIKLS